MVFETQLKKTGSKEINGRELTFTYEHAEGELPSTIEVSSQIAGNGTSQTISALYNVQNNTLSRCQVFNVPLGENADIVRSIETELAQIVESFNSNES